MNKWRRHIASGVIALGVASMVPGLALAQANSYGNQGTGTGSEQQTNGQPNTNSNEPMGSGMSNSNGQMGSGMSRHENAGMSQHQKMSKHEVMQIQTALNQAGEHVAVDGIMGPHTHSALRKYQESNGLPATGRPTEQTLQKLGVNNQG